MVAYRSRRAVRACAAVLSACIALTGCGTYPLTGKLAADITPKPAGEGAIAFAGDIADAMDAVDAQRQLYFKAVGDHAHGRRILGTSLLVLSGLAVYKGITSDSESTKHWLARAGAFGGAAFAVGTFLSNKSAEGAYLSGYRDITCSLLWARPLLIRQDEFAAWSKEVDALERKIAQVDLELSRVQTLRYQELELPGGDQINTRLGDEFKHLYDALAKSRKLLENSRTLQRRVQTAGFTLRRRVEAIVADISGRVHATENALPAAQTAVSDVQTFTKTFQGIKPVQQEDTGGAGAKSDGKPSTESDTSKPAATAATTAKPAAQTTLGQQADATVLKQQARIKKLEADAKKKAATQKPKPLATPKVTEKHRLSLRTQLSQLYAQHRKVNMMLVGVNELLRTVKELDPCKEAGEGALVVSPDVEEMNLDAGKSVQFSITGGKGVPRVWLVGAKADGSKEITLTTSVDAGTVIAKVTAPEEASAGTSYLVVTDGVGRQKEEIALKIVPKPAEKKEEDKK